VSPEQQQLQGKIARLRAEIDSLRRTNADFDHVRRVMAELARALRTSAAQSPAEERFHLVGGTPHETAAGDQGGATRAASAD
jgi:hypothetical protein